MPTCKRRQQVYRGSVTRPRGRSPWAAFGEGTADGNPPSQCSRGAALRIRAPQDQIAVDSANIASPCFSASKPKRRKRASVTYAIPQNILLFFHNPAPKRRCCNELHATPRVSAFAARSNNDCKVATVSPRWYGFLSPAPLWSSPFFKGELEGVLCRFSAASSFKNQINEEIEYRISNTE